jgi:transcriptional regulator with XRE-family HTH domain
MAVSDSVAFVRVPNTLYQVLGNTIQAERRKAKISQEKLAEITDLNRNYIGEIERAEKKITIETLWRIAKALKLRVRDLVNEL